MDTGEALNYLELARAGIAGAIDVIGAARTNMVRAGRCGVKNVDLVDELLDYVIEVLSEDAMAIIFRLIADEVGCYNDG